MSFEVERPVKAAFPSAHPLPDEKDVEAGEAEEVPADHTDESLKRLEKLQQQYGSTWSGPNDPEDPYNWPSSRKILTGVLVSFGQLVTLMAASMVAPALPEIGVDLNIDSTTAQLVFTTYFLGLGFGPFLIAPLSEMSGRKRVWLVANGWFLLWNSLCPVGSSAGVMIAGRLLSGVGASVGVTLTGPIMADMYGAADRGKSIALAAFLPYLGPALGPIIGGASAEHISWPWLFWIISIADAAMTVAGALFLHESYTPQLLRARTAKRARTAHQAGDPTAPAVPSRRQVMSRFLSNLATNARRPIHLLLRRPVLPAVSLAMGLNFGIYCIVLAAYAQLYLDAYGESQLSSSLHYISLAIGTTAAAQIGGHVMDWSYRTLRKRRPDGAGRPEFRIPFGAAGSLLIPVGLFWYAWSGAAVAPWILVDIGAAVFTLGGFIMSQAFLAYLLDEFAEHAASANAASRLLSYVFGFAFPIFTPNLYSTLGFGWGNSLLAFLSIALICPIPVVFWFWGERLRAVGRKVDV